MLRTFACLRVLGYAATFPGTFAHGVGSSYSLSLFRLQSRWLSSWRRCSWISNLLGLLTTSERFTRWAGTWHLVRIISFLTLKGWKARLLWRFNIPPNWFKVSIATEWYVRWDLYSTWFRNELALWRHLVDMFSRVFDIIFYSRVHPSYSRCYLDTLLSSCRIDHLKYLNSGRTCKAALCSMHGLDGIDSFGT